MPTCRYEITLVVCDDCDHSFTRRVLDSGSIDDEFIEANGIDLTKVADCVDDLLPSERAPVLTEIADRQMAVVTSAVQ